MTLPSIVDRYQEKVTVNKLKQTYSLLSQAFEQAINEEVPVENWCNINGGSETYNDCSLKMTNILGRYVKKLRDCYDFSKDKNICLDSIYRIVSQKLLIFKKVSFFIRPLVNHKTAL